MQAKEQKQDTSGKTDYQMNLDYSQTDCQEKKRNEQTLLVLSHATITSGKHSNTLKHNSWRTPK